MKGLSETFHQLFMKVCRLGIQIHNKGKTGDAHGIFSDLITALFQYPGLGDDRKNGALWEMSRFHQDQGNEDENERVLAKAVEICDISLPEKNSCQSLASSLQKPSSRAGRDLSKTLEEYYLDKRGIPPAIPAIQRSGLHKNPEVASILISTSKGGPSPPALCFLDSLHLAAIEGHQDTLTCFLSKGADVDARSLLGYTALFLAAEKGHEGCCAELIKYNADVNRRNFHGNTILEVAVGAGHLKIVQRLVAAGAEVNPEFVCCESSPLQAASENQKKELNIALFLIGQDADVSTRRRDGKNAIDLAEENNNSFLANILRQKEQQDLQGDFAQDVFAQPPTYRFGHGDLGFGSRHI